MKVICKNSFAMYFENIEYNSVEQVDADYRVSYYVHEIDYSKTGLYISWDDYHDNFIDNIEYRKQKILKLKERICLKSVTK